MNNDVFKEEIPKLIKKLDVLYKGRAHLLCSLTFLLHCRHMGTILNIIKIRRVLTSDQAHRVYNRTEWIFLREYIYDTHWKPENNHKKLMATHL